MRAIQVFDPLAVFGDEFIRVNFPIKPKAPAPSNTGFPELTCWRSQHAVNWEMKSPAVQLGLNFSALAPELFVGEEMGEDALRVLGQYLKLFSRFQTSMSAEIPLMREAFRWDGRFIP